MHFAPYLARLKVRDFEKAEIDKMLSQEVIEPARGRMSRTNKIWSKLNGFLHICVDYKSLKAVTKRDSYSYTRMYKCNDSLWEAAVL